MTRNELPHRWADQCSVALSSLFEREEATVADSHDVLLDAGLRSVFCGVHMEEVKQRDGAIVGDIRADAEPNLGLAL
jgi:hypothetical protein